MTPRRAPTGVQVAMAQAKSRWIPLQVSRQPVGLADRTQYSPSLCLQKSQHIPPERLERRKGFESLQNGLQRFPQGRGPCLPANLVQDRRRQGCVVYALEQLPQLYPLKV